MTNVDNIVYFMANDGSHGYELWKSDGTASGTVLVKDIFEGLGDSEPDPIDQRQRHPVFHGLRASTAASCGRATARLAARSSSRTSSRGLNPRAQTTGTSSQT